ncbi:MAG: class I SAM-dependent methyltransferase [Terracidiphilus sp.]
MAQEIQDFYDRYPYPPPVNSLDQYRRLWQDPHRRRADHHLFWPQRSFREDHSILIAGCGTSQAAKYAFRWPRAQITGIDLSATSVQYTVELKRRYGLDNLQVYQLPIDRVTDLAQTFDQIVCTGVLHHLSDPDVGLAALRDVLKLDGAMHLMVYAPYGRTGIYMLQEFCRRLHIHPTDADIRKLAAALKALPHGHPLEHLLNEVLDFRHEAALADALLHPQDRAYSVPQFFDFVRRGRLTFGRWIRQAPYSARCGVMAQIPQSSQVAALPLEEQFAVVELFRGTMVRHSAVVYRNDRSEAAQPVKFSGDRWPGFVPIRMSDTICAQEPRSASAESALINQNHTYRDLLLAISSAEKDMFDAINGDRTIIDIARAALPNSPEELRLEVTRTFFERLWWHDQVVFDTSGTQGTKAMSLSRAAEMSRV